MKVGNGTDYSQNYDLIVKWLSAAFRGETLEVLGLKTGRIEEGGRKTGAKKTIGGNHRDVLRDNPSQKTAEANA